MGLIEDELESDLSTLEETPVNSRVTRSGVQASAQSTTPSSASGMSHLLRLFSPLFNDGTTPQRIAQQTTQPPLSNQLAHQQPRPPTIPEGDQLDFSAEGLLDTSLLHTQPPSQPNHDEAAPPGSPSSQSSSSQTSKNTTPSLDSFGAAFGGHEAIRRLPQLEAMRQQWLQPQMERNFASIECSQFTRHMWSHAKDLQFEKRADLYAWCRENMEVDVLQKIPAISAMKSAGTKNCALCMYERVELFHGFHRQNMKNKKSSNSPNLLKSRNELYSSCSCKTRFLRLTAVGNGGADEAASRPKTARGGRARNREGISV